MLLLRNGHDKHKIDYIQCPKHTNPPFKMYMAIAKGITGTTTA